LELYELTAHQLSERLGTGEVSSREIVTSCYDRIEAVEGKVQAFVSQTRQLAE